MSDISSHRTFLAIGHHYRLWWGALNRALFGRIATCSDSRAPHHYPLRSSHNAKSVYFDE